MRGPWGRRHWMRDLGMKEPWRRILDGISYLDEASGTFEDGDSGWDLKMNENLAKDLGMEPLM